PPTVPPITPPPVTPPPIIPPVVSPPVTPPTIPPVTLPPVVPPGLPLPAGPAPGPTSPPPGATPPKAPPAPVSGIPPAVVLAPAPVVAPAVGPVPVGTVVSEEDLAAATPAGVAVADTAREETHEIAVTEAAVVTGVGLTAGYVLLNTRAVYWFLSALLARPAVWRRFDPIDVILAWENDPDDRPGTDDESLASMVK